MTAVGFSVIVLTIVIATCLQATIGFGLGMLSAPLIAIFDPAFLPGGIIMLSLFITVTVMIRERQHMDLKGAGIALLGRLPGTLLGTWLVVAIPRDALAWVVVGTVLVGLVSMSLGWAPQPRWPALVTAGAASGFMGTATSMGGAPMSIVWQRSEGGVLRGTMSAFLLLGSLMSAVALLVAGEITWTTALHVVWLVPAVAVGFLLSIPLTRVLDKAKLRLFALVATAVGLVMLVITLIW